jgi:ubiquinone/menaquinone biosynthesis C-methylase UbiE
MTTASPPRDHARIAYDIFAPHYDAFTAHHDYEAWTTSLEALARDAGLRGNRMLDLACGTGKSFLPFLECGYDVTAGDVSSAMLAVAAERSQGRVRCRRWRGRWRIRRAGGSCRS